MADELTGRLVKVANPLAGCFGATHSLRSRLNLRYGMFKLPSSLNGNAPHATSHRYPSGSEK
jgi:hypothetical protein